MNPYVKRSVTGILRVSGVFKGSGSLGELRSPDEVEVKNGHPLECLGRQKRHWRRYQHHERVRVVGHWEGAFATFRDLTRTSLRTQWRRQAPESSEPRLRGFVQSWVDLKTSASQFVGWRFRSGHTALNVHSQMTDRIFVCPATNDHGMSSNTFDCEWPVS